jgi:hypothetical protein
LGSAVITGLEASPASAVTQEHDVTTSLLALPGETATTTFSCEVLDPNVPFIEGAAPTRTTPKDNPTDSSEISRSISPAAFATVFDRRLGRTVQGATAIRIKYTNNNVFIPFFQIPIRDRLWCTSNATDAWLP